MVDLKALANRTDWKYYNRSSIRIKSPDTDNRGLLRPRDPTTTPWTTPRTRWTPTTTSRTHRMTPTTTWAPRMRREAQNK